MFKNSLSYFFLSRLIFSKRSTSLIRRISVLSFLGISVSVALFFIVLFVMNGMNVSIKERIIQLDPTVSVTFLSSQKIEDSEKIIQSLLEQKGHAISFESYDLILRTIDGQFRGTQALGYNDKGLQQWSTQLDELKLKQQQTQKNKVYQSAVESENLQLGQDEIAIGVDLARSLGLLEGDVVTLIPAESLLLSSVEAPIFEKVTVKKILVTDLYDLDSKLLFFNKELSLKNLKQSPSKTAGVHIWLNQISEMDNLKKQLSASGFTQTETWEEKNSVLFSALFLEKLMIGLFLGLAGLIASSSILTVLALVLTQKSMDIAIIKTLGYSSKQTLWLFTYLGLWISLSGLFVGAFIGIGLSYYLQFFPLQILPQIYYDSSISAQVHLGFAATVMVIISGLALVGCYIPAKASLKIEPALLLKAKA